MYSKVALPTDYWLGRGYPLNPYITGVVVDMLRRELRPKEFSLIPEAIPLGIGGKTTYFLEYSVVRRWTGSWAKLVHWYWSVAMSPDVTVDQLLWGAPVVSKHWYASEQDECLVQFGLLWRAFDLVHELMTSGRPPLALPESVCCMKEPYLIGGCGDSTFLVCCVGLEQPHARSGVVFPGLDRKDYPVQAVGFIRRWASQSAN
jgi:hypothetical protein